MSTTLPQSQWLNRIAQERIEQACSMCAGRGEYTRSILVGSINDDQDIDHYGESCAGCKGAGVVRPYERDGTAGWLRAKKGSEWPSLVWASGGLGFFAYRLLWWQTEYSVLSHIKWYHALDLLDAFALLEEAGWIFSWNSANKPAWHAFKKYQGIVAGTPEELLDKIMAEEAKHGDLC